MFTMLKKGAWHLFGFFQQAVVGHAKIAATQFA
jgi:hypothetical protein